MLERISALLGNDLFRLVFVLLVSQVVIWIGRKTITKTIFIFSKGDHSKSRQAMLDTYCKLIGSFFKYLVYIIDVIIILAIYDINVITILTSAGFIGIMITYMFQDIIKDVTNGFFLVFAAPFTINDRVKIGDFVGIVTEINSRYIVLLDTSNNVCVINNRAIDKVVVLNKSINFVE